MKTTYTLFLLLALLTMLYTNMGQVGGVYMGISEARKEAASNLKSKDLSTLVISQSDFQSGKAAYISEKEIIYNGDMYDVSSSVSQNGKVIFKVLRDEKEEGILAHLKDIVDGWLNTPKNTKQHSSKQIVSINDFMPVEKLTFTYSVYMEHLFVAVPVSSTESPSMAVLKSPPKLA